MISPLRRSRSEIWRKGRNNYLTAIAEFNGIDGVVVSADTEEPMAAIRCIPASFPLRPLIDGEQSGLQSTWQAGLDHVFLFQQS
jgi:hypothetical protein